MFLWKRRKIHTMSRSLIKLLNSLWNLTKAARREKGRKRDQQLIEQLPPKTNSLRRRRMDLAPIHLWKRAIHQVHWQSRGKNRRSRSSRWNLSLEGKSKDQSNSRRKMGRSPKLMKEMMRIRIVPIKLNLKKWLHLQLTLALKKHKFGRPDLHVVCLGLGAFKYVYHHLSLTKLTITSEVLTSVFLMRIYSRIRELSSCFIMERNNFIKEKCLLILKSEGNFHKKLHKIFLIWVELMIIGILFWTLLLIREFLKVMP